MTDQGGQCAIFSLVHLCSRSWLVTRRANVCALPQLEPNSLSRGLHFFTLQNTGAHGAHSAPRTTFCREKVRGKVRMFARTSVLDGRSVRRSRSSLKLLITRLASSEIESYEIATARSERSEDEKE